MHLKRWITAIVLIPPLILLLLYGGKIFFAILAIAVSTLTLREFYRIAFSSHEVRVPPFFSFWGYFTGFLIIISSAAGRTDTIVPILIVNVFGAAVVSLSRFKSSQDAPFIVAVQSFGVVYIPVFLSFGVMLRNSSDGALWILFVIGLVAMGDTGAYYTGTYFGRHKLCPAVSPKKTIEGSVGGLIAGLIFALIFKWLFLNQLGLVACIVIALVAGAMGQIGDLFESEFKRSAGVKDSGNLLPGHGGIFDRIDALLFALPTAFIIKDLLMP